MCAGHVCVLGGGPQLHYTLRGAWKNTQLYGWLGKGPPKAKFRKVWYQPSLILLHCEALGSSLGLSASSSVMKGSGWNNCSIAGCWRQFWVQLSPAVHICPHQAT